MRKSIIVGAALLLAGCGADPISKTDTGNPRFTASIIGKVDGCDIWRMQDGSARTLYFARCGSRTMANIGAVESCGKNCTNVPTVLSTGD